MNSRSTRWGGGAVVFALTVLLTYFAAWVAWHNIPVCWDDVALVTIQYHLVCGIDNAVHDYAAKHGEYPASLTELAATLPADDPLRGELVSPCDPNCPHNIWHHRLQYTRTAKGYRLLSLGRDGRPGGVGVDTDLELTPSSPQAVPPTLSQFLWGMKWSPRLLIGAIIAGGFAASAWLFPPKERRKPTTEQHSSRRMNIVERVGWIVFTTAFSIALGLLITFIHSCTGH